MRKFLILMIMPLLGLTFAACNDEQGSYPPTYQGFRYEPAAVHPGDSVLITAVQQKKGHYLNSTDYSWSMTIYVEENGETHAETLNANRHTNYGGQDSSDPTWGIRLPENTIAGQYSVQFKAQWSNSADGIGGTFSAGTGEGCTGSITAYSYTLYSQASGSFRLRVQ